MHETSPNRISICLEEAFDKLAARTHPDSYKREDFTNYQRRLLSMEPCGSVIFLFHYR